MNYQKYLEKNTHNLGNKNVVITGATGGIGKELCLYLTKLNANIILVSRNIDKLNNLKKEIINTDKKISVSIYTCDFSNLNSVKECCESLKKLRIDYFVHNAGAYCLPKNDTIDGYNNVFQINAISPYFITKYLIENFKANNTKVIIVNSISSKFNKIDKSNIEYKDHKPIILYGNSKKYELLSLTKLLEENKINYCVAHPGITPTEITRNYNKFNQLIIKYPMKIIFTSKRKATLNILKAFFVDAHYPSWIGPRIFNIWGLPKLNKISLKDDDEFVYQAIDNIYNKFKLQSK